MKSLEIVPKKLLIRFHVRSFMEISFHRQSRGKSSSDHSSVFAAVTYVLSRADCLHCLLVTSNKNMDDRVGKAMESN